MAGVPVGWLKLNPDPSDGLAVVAAGSADVAVEPDAAGSPKPVNPPVVPESPNRLFGCSGFFSSSFFSVGFETVPKVNGAGAVGAGTDVVLVVVVVEVVVEAGGAPNENPLTTAGGFSVVLDSEAPFVVAAGAGAPNNAPDEDDDEPLPNNPDPPVEIEGAALNENGATLLSSLSFLLSAGGGVVGGATPVFWKILALAKKFGMPPLVLVLVVLVGEVAAGAKENAGAGAGADVGAAGAAGVPKVVVGLAELVSEKGREEIGASLNPLETIGAGGAGVGVVDTVDYTEQEQEQSISA